MASFRRTLSRLTISKLYAETEQLNQMLIIVDADTDAVAYNSINSAALVLLSAQSLKHDNNTTPHLSLF